MIYGHDRILFCHPVMHYGRAGSYFVTSVMHLGLDGSYFVMFAGLPAKIFLKLEVLEVIF